MKKFQVLEIKGNHKDVGIAIGESFKKEIQETIKLRKEIIPNYYSYLDKSRKYFEYTKKIFPNLITETENIANTAGVDIMDYFFMNNREVYDTAEQYDKKYAFGIDHCTVAVGFGKDGSIIGQNEDWSVEASDKLYVLKVTIKDTSFICLSYKTEIPGNSASINSWGLVQCINDLYQNVQLGIPKNYLARAILESQTLDNAEHLISNTKKASGFNHVLIQNNEIRNIEIAGNQISVKKSKNSPYVHTNHYISSKLQKLEKFHTTSSEKRYTRAKELVVNVKTKEDMQRLLSDTKDKDFPICRIKETIGSVIIIPSKNEFFVCCGHPCANDFIQYNI